MIPTAGVVTANVPERTGRRNPGGPTRCPSTLHPARRCEPKRACELRYGATDARAAARTEHTPPTSNLSRHVMSRRPRGIVPRVVALFLVITALAPQTAVFGPASAFADPLTDRIDGARQQQKDLQGSIDRQRALLSSLQADEQAAQNAISDSTAQLHQINANQATVKAKIEAA